MSTRRGSLRGARGQRRLGRLAGALRSRGSRDVPGRPREALQLLQEAIAARREGGTTPVCSHRTMWRWRRPIWRWAIEDARRPRPAKLLNRAHTKARVSGRCCRCSTAGDEKGAEEIARDARQHAAAQTTAYARLISAEIAFRRGRYAEAVEGFRDSIKRRDTWLGRAFLGRVYVETKHYQEAMAEQEICLKRRGEVTDVFFYDTPSLRYLPPTYYWLAAPSRRWALPMRRRITSASWRCERATSRPIPWRSTPGNELRRHRNEHPYFSVMLSLVTALPEATVWPKAGISRKNE